MARLRAGAIKAGAPVEPAIKCDVCLRTAADVGKMVRFSKFDICSECIAVGIEQVARRDDRMNKTIAVQDEQKGSN